VTRQIDRLIQLHMGALRRCCPVADIEYHVATLGWLRAWRARAR
jgi:hypothetical protein